MKKLVFGVSLVLSGLAGFAQEIKASSEYPEFYNGDSTKGIDFVQAIKVLAPLYCSNVKGDVTVVFEAKGLKLVYVDDFDGPLSISSDGRGAMYAAHKTGGGDFSGWPYDLERYGNESDMWVDWVRVYCGKPLPKDFGKIPSVGVLDDRRSTRSINITCRNTII